MKTKKVKAVKIKQLLDSTRADKEVERIEAQVSPSVLEGRYSNFAMLRHSPREFIMDFMFRMESTNVLISRIIASPQYAKEIHDALGRNIEHFEKEYGEIMKVGK